MTKIALGTAQFGLPYGISSASGQVALDEVNGILACAREHGISMLDTAVSYGNSETVLGKIGVDAWNVVSKLPALPEDVPDVQAWVESQVSDSLLRLGVPKLYGLLLHRPGQLLEARGGELYGAMQEIRRRGLVDRIGISIYAPNELDDLAAKKMQFDLVQAPYNVVDNRMITSGWLPRLNDRGCEVHVRSAFLQGLLLMSRDDRPAQFGPWRSLWVRFDEWLNEVSMTPLEACLRHALSAPGVSHVVVGVQSLRHLKEILVAASGQAVPVPSELHVDDSRLLNPSRWSLS